MNSTPSFEITVFRDYVEDKRKSMEIYGEEFINEFKLLFGKGIIFNEFRPKIPFWAQKITKKSRLGIRFARYLAYPLQARVSQGSLNHILDQSYGHLLKVLNGKRTLITVHDLIPLLAWKGLIPGMSYPNFPFLYKLSVNSLKSARCVVAVSHSTKKDLIDHCGLPEEKIKVVYNGLSKRFRPESEGNRLRLKKSFGLPIEGIHCILITGSQTYKNHLTSLRVVERLQSICKKPVQLISLGADNSELDSYLSKVRLKRPVIRLKDIDNQRIVDLYNSIDCLLFPSWYEGFGWPPIESMACGTPAVTSDSGSLPEVLGNAAIMAKPGDVEKLTEATQIMLEDDMCRKEFVERGLKNAALFTWESCASKYSEIYTKLLTTNNF